MAETSCETPRSCSGLETPASITVFVCANCARPGQAPSSAGRPRPVVPDFAWSVPVSEVLVPCTGRLQPEHVLKAFESGADVVCAVACEDDNCHYVEGSRRCARRVEYVRAVLEEIGLDGRRLMLFSLPGTAAEDMALALGKPAPAHGNGVNARIAAIRDQVMRALGSLSPNPLGAPPSSLESEDSSQEADASYDDSEQ
jgi:F420-non-reducing hydrogenase iron-sulfur subunit